MRYVRVTIQQDHRVRVDDDADLNALDACDVQDDSDTLGDPTIIDAEWMDETPPDPRDEPE